MPFNAAVMLILWGLGCWYQGHSYDGAVAPSIATLLGPLWVAIGYWSCDWYQARRGLLRYRGMSLGGTIVPVLAADPQRPRPWNGLALLNGGPNSGEIVPLAKLLESIDEPYADSRQGHYVKMGQAMSGHMIYTYEPRSNPDV